VLPFAPISRLIDWWSTDTIWRELKRRRPSQLGLEALEVLKSEEGNGEQGNNRGPHIKRWGGKQGKSWCAAVVYFAIEKASERLCKPVPFERSNGARKLFRRAVGAGMRIRKHDMQPGDLVLWARGPNGSWMAHIGIVSRVERGPGYAVERWQYFAGNEGARAMVEEHDGTEKTRLIGFARLP